jgi:hypothetical protein
MAVADLETLWAGIGDSLYGFRVYPHRTAALGHEGSSGWMRRFDFDPGGGGAHVLARRHRPSTCDATVRYFRPAEGGVSHFNYLRDNVLLVSMHLRLVMGALVRLPLLALRRLSGPASTEKSPVP